MKKWFRRIAGVLTPALLLVLIHATEVLAKLPGLPDTP